MAFDFTISVDLNHAFNEKINKYKGLLRNQVIPIAISPWMTIHAESAKLLKKYANLKKIYKEFAYKIMALDTQKLKIYQTSVTMN